MIQEIKANQQDLSKVRNVQTKEKIAPLTPEQEQTIKSIDTVELGTNQSPSTLYTKPKGKELKASDIDALKQQADKTYEGLRNLVRQMLLKQREAAGKHKPDSIELTSTEEAGLSISEDGEFGVKAVSDRIVNFAIAVSDNDPAKLAELKEAIDKGFAAAEKTFGGKLPDICYQTHDEIMKKLDQWSEGEKA
jgi:DNA-directed RNA polymerase subunit F